MKKIIEVSVGIICNEKQEILLSFRAQHQALGGFWEFPGGKLELGENSYQALCRELIEEVDIEVNEAESLTNLLHDYPLYLVKLYPWLVKKYSGIAVGKEGQTIMWKNLHQLQTLNFLPANYAIIEELQKIMMKCKLIA